MAKKDTQKKLQEILDRKKKAEEELKAVKRLMAKEEREERKKCYLEVGKIVESCMGRNFREEDIDTFAAFARENEDDLKALFAEDAQDTSRTEEESEGEEAEAVSQEAPPFG